MSMDQEDKEMLRKVTSAAAVALFAGQANGLLAFPAGPLTIGEIETKLTIMADAFIAKADELDAAS